MLTHAKAQFEKRPHRLRRRRPRPRRPRGIASRSRHPTRRADSPEDEYSAPRAPPPQPRARRRHPSRRRSTLADGAEVHARPRRRHDRGDHLVHEHLEPVGHARGRPARPQRRARRASRPSRGSRPRSRPGSKVVTDYYEKAGLDQRPRGPRLLHRRLRLHDLHRQLRSAHRGGLGRGQRERPRRHRGALGQPQLRGPHQPRREDELPREPAAGHRLRAGRLDELRLRDRRRSARTRTATTSSSRTSGPTPAEVQATIDSSINTEHVHARSTRASSTGDERWRTLPTPDRRRLRVGRRSRPTCASPRTSTA